MKAMRLGVNIDHVATLRQARGGQDPDPVQAALVCEGAGAQSIVCHLREDRRHIQDEDVRRLRQTIATRLNLEMSIAPDIVAAALNAKPDQATLVPERRRELTTEGGLDTVRLGARLARAVNQLQAHGIVVSLFIDPLTAQVDAARRLGVRTVELHTGGYANARTPAAQQREFVLLRRAAGHAAALGLQVAAGHGLTHENITPLLTIPELEEVNIGFSIIARSLTVGLASAVREMRERLEPVQTSAGASR